MDDEQEPIRIPITDVFDLHTVQPREVAAVVEAYLEEASRLGFKSLRIIHGRGIGVQREIVRAVLARTPQVTAYADAPPEAGDGGPPSSGCGNPRLGNQGQLARNHFLTVHSREHLHQRLRVGGRHQIPGVTDGDLVASVRQPGHGLGNEVLQRHGLRPARASRLAWTAQLRGNIGRNQLNHLNSRTFQLVA